MDLSTFHLVDAINDMDMLRNLSDQQQPEPYSHRQPSNNNSNNAYDQLQGDIDLLFQPDQINSSPQNINSYVTYKNMNMSQSNKIMVSPRYNQHQNGYFDQEDILTPLISPAMTPSFGYQVHHQKNHHSSVNFNNNNSSNNDMDFSPLSSPAILPQTDRHGNHHHQASRTSFQDQLASSVGHNNSRNPNGDSYKNMSANQICEQYEQLEHAKLLITQKLSELQKSQQQFNHYDDQDYQRNLLPSESNSSKDSEVSQSKTNGMSMVQQKMNGDHMSIHHLSVMSRPSSPNKSPLLEPATPASLMNIKMNSSNSSKLQFSSSGRSQPFYSKPTSNITNNSTSTMNFNTLPISALNNGNGHVFQSPILNTDPIHENNTLNISPTITPTNTMNNHHTVPLSPLALHPRGMKSRTSSTLKEKHGSRTLKKQRRESADSKASNGIHASPRALKPLLISPTLNPGIKPLPNSIIPTRSVQSVEDAERILATRSNYQNLMEGKGAALGIAFSTQIKSGLEVRRTAHKAAEQKRRDSLKEWFDRLRCEVEDGYVKRQKTLMSQVIKAQELEKNHGHKSTSNTTDEEAEELTPVDGSAMKPLSKVLLLQYAYEYISSLKSTLQERDSTIESLLSGEFGANKISGGGTKRRQENEDDSMGEDTDNDNVTNGSF
ncbi:hypothetical protein INT47_003147 [Mucor saturninus]|uniref:BHLH domain-containing protein n=1 Tax=Mucor saturninus TaxID=64648 RepID=A0A8H7QY53_9FUNG|nr:hypothetical protein INT47_003147 [Mucor saturninus]